MSAPSLRFRVSLSFSGEQREFVSLVANELAATFGQDAILYDKYHEAEFSRARLNRHLPKLYHDQSDLAVAIFSSTYAGKEWCGLEWDALFDLIAKKQEDKVMLCRFNHAEPDGLYGAGFAELDGRSPQDCARLILERLALNEGKRKDHYALADRAAVVAIAPARSAAARVDDPVQYEERVRKVFGAQFDQLKLVLERNPELRDELVRRFEADTIPAAYLPGFLLMKFHDSFLQAIGLFYQIADETPVDRGALLELVSSVIYLSMCPEFADASRQEKNAMQFEVSKDARQGIMEMLLVWNRQRGRTPVPLRHLSQEKPAELFETPPQMQMTAIKHALMDRLKIKRDAVDAEARLRLELEKWKNRGRPEILTLAADTEAEKALLREITAPDSPLRHLLILLKLDGKSIHPRLDQERRKAGDPSFDRAVEENLSDLIRKLTNP